MLGYGISVTELTDALYFNSNDPTPAAVIIDSGSTDGGPSKLAIGNMGASREVYKKTLSELLSITHTFREDTGQRVPIIVTSAGGDGSSKHVDEYVDIIRDIVAGTPRGGKPLKIVTLYAEISKEIVLSRLNDGKITGCGSCVPPLSTEAIDRSPIVVAQMGPEPILAGLTSHPDVDILIAGRAYDPAGFVAWCAFNASVRLGTTFDQLSPEQLGGFEHMGKTLECGGLCAEPKSRGASALVYADGSFEISAMAEDAKCTPLSVAAHTFYENSRPDLLSGPGGQCELSGATYEQLSDQESVRVFGARFNRSKSMGKPYQIKLEAAKTVGYRTMFFGVFRDPIICSQLPMLLGQIKEYASQYHFEDSGKFELDFHIFGQNNSGSEIPKELTIICEGVADTQALATDIVHTARFMCVHAPYPGQKATGGNMAQGFGGKYEVEMGLCCEFSTYHLMDLEEGEEEAVEVDETTMPKKDSKKGLFPMRSFTMPFPSEANGAAQEASLPLPTSKKLPKPRKLPNFKLPASANPTLSSVARIIRSKNAGPFEMTFDVLFSDAKTYQAIKAANILNAKVIANL